MWTERLAMNEAKSKCSILQYLQSDKSVLNYVISIGKGVLLSKIQESQAATRDDDTSAPCSLYYPCIQLLFFLSLSLAAD